MHFLLGVAFAFAPSLAGAETFKPDKLVGTWFAEIKISDDADKDGEYTDAHACINSEYFKDGSSLARGRINVISVNSHSARPHLEMSFHFEIQSRWMLTGDKLTEKAREANLSSDYAKTFEGSQSVMLAKDLDKEFVEKMTKEMKDELLKSDDIPDVIQELTDMSFVLIDHSLDFKKVNYRRTPKLGKECDER